MFAFSLDGLYSLTLGKAGNLRGGLRFCGDWVQDVNTANLSSLDERAKRSSDSFYFG